MTKSLLENIDFDFDQVDEKLKETIFSLLNIIEELAKDNIELRQDNQRLRDENNRLKGEQGKPEIKPRRKNISSEQERKKHQKSVHKKRRKNPHIKGRELNNLNKSSNLIIIKTMKLFLQTHNLINSQS